MKRTLKRLGIISLAALLLGVAALAVQRLTGNFHEVVPHELYRSAQFSPERLADYQRRYGIRSVINLRGENMGSDWYDAEVATARDLGIAHLDFRMSAREQLPQARAAELVALMRQAPKPLLIHCLAGADRTGFAVALYLAAVADRGEEPSEWQLSILYGHLALPWVSPAYQMDESWERLEPWLGFPNS